MFARELHKSGRNPGDIQSLVIGDGSTSRVWRHDYWFLLPGNENCSEPQILNSEFVRHLNPNVKIIIMVRNPTERLYSGYYFYSGVAGQRSPTKENFHWLVKKQIARLQNCRILVGVYHVFIADWLLRIPRDQIYIIRLEDFSADVTAGMTKVFAFLDLAQPDRETMTNITAIQRRNVGKLALRSHPMLAETRAMLDDFYRPHNQRLAELLHDRRFLWQDQ
ncbi:hypothetical protein BaRGS_00035939 [Batillaria attramentaria]|uniref:Sulfotransferase domain-containing protein n=1 Tax=Batillaria attramentaria TaxID=370345 RepID=A0ABD0JDX9_9CAEN